MTSLQQEYVGLMEQAAAYPGVEAVIEVYGRIAPNLPVAPEPRSSILSVSTGGNA